MSESIRYRSEIKKETPEKKKGFRVENSLGSSRILESMNSLVGPRFALSYSTTEVPDIPTIANFISCELYFLQTLSIQISHYELYFLRHETTRCDSEFLKEYETYQRAPDENYILAGFRMSNN